MIGFFYSTSLGNYFREYGDDALPEPEFHGESLELMFYQAGKVGSLFSITYMELPEILQNRVIFL